MQKVKRKTERRKEGERRHEKEWGRRMKEKHFAE